MMVFPAQKSFLCRKRFTRLRDCESIMTLASPFVKGGSRGILLSYRLLIFNNNFLMDQISPNPSLLKRGIKRILSQSRQRIHSSVFI